ncbi:hypothetical protein THAOC_33455, partial [Thalassiosira oceanica]
KEEEPAKPPRWCDARSKAGGNDALFEHGQLGFEASSIVTKESGSSSTRGALAEEDRHPASISASARISLVVRPSRRVPPLRPAALAEKAEKEDVKAARTRRILLDSGDMSLEEEQHQLQAPAVPAAGPLPEAVTEEQLPAGKHSKLMPCCMKMVCNGCILASRKRGMGKMCAFCRTPTPDSDAAALALVRKRVDAKDPEAIGFLARTYFHGNYGLQQDTSMAIELWTEAALLGDLKAHFKLGWRYYQGEGVEQDVAKGTRHLQHASIQGHPEESRFALGHFEDKSGNHELAVQHLLISAKMGLQKSLNEIKGMFMKGHATKAQYAEALKGYQNALEETMSPQRAEVIRMSGLTTQISSSKSNDWQKIFTAGGQAGLERGQSSRRGKIAGRTVFPGRHSLQGPLVSPHLPLSLNPLSSNLEDELGHGVAVLIPWARQLRATGSRPPASPGAGLPPRRPEGGRLSGGGEGAEPRRVSLRASRRDGTLHVGGERFRSLGWKSRRIPPGVLESEESRVADRRPLRHALPAVLPGGRPVRSLSLARCVPAGWRLVSVGMGMPQAARALDHSMHETTTSSRRSLPFASGSPTIAVHPARLFEVVRLPS